MKGFLLFWNKIIIYRVGDSPTNVSGSDSEFLPICILFTITTICQNCWQRKPISGRNLRADQVMICWWWKMIIQLLLLGLSLYNTMTFDSSKVMKKGRCCSKWWQEENLVEVLQLYIQTELNKLFWSNHLLKIRVSDILSWTQF